MTSNVDSDILKDVVAYVDVWSSSKTDNYSKPFIQNLQEMGAEVSKTFNKQVTHVVFKNGHQATWNKAKKTGVRLVSVLWVARCQDDCVHVDEELYPALNDEVNPALKKRAHRCMQPRETRENTPESERRMKKKLDKMMKDIAPIPPLATDVSPFIIDEESGVVYSPSMKRSDSMAQRLKVMREKRENLSPTASQTEVRLSPERKPSLGGSPSMTLFGDESDDDFNLSSGAQRSHKKPAGKQREDPAGRSLETPPRKDSPDPWLSPCRDTPPTPKPPVGSPPPSFPLFLSEESKSGRGRSSVESGSLSVGKSRRLPSTSKKAKGTPLNRRRTIQAVHECKTKTKTDLEAGSVPSCLTSTVILDDAPFQLKSSDVSTLSLKGGKQAKRGPSSPATALPSPGSDSPFSTAPCAEDHQDFDDYFSPANQPWGRGVTPLRRCLSSEPPAQPPAERESNPAKRKRRKSETTESANDAAFNYQPPLQRDAKGPPSIVDGVVALSKRLPLARQSTLSFSVVKESPSKRRRSNRPSSTASTPVAGEDEQSPGAPRHPDGEERSSSHVETVGRGSVCDAAADDTATVCKQNSQVNEVAKGMDKETKTMRTLVMTSMPTEKQQTVVQVVRALGGFSVVDRVCESTTHVVSGGHKRTVNILLGIARGCWVLSFEWILWCLEQRQWIPEEPYELSDHFPAAPICRLQQHLSAGEHQQDLFLGQPPMLVSRCSQPPSHSLQELITLCGGTVCRTARQAGLFIGEYKGKRPEGSRLLSEQWVLDCITHLQQLPYTHYELEG